MNEDMYDPKFMNYALLSSTAKERSALRISDNNLEIIVPEFETMLSMKAGPFIVINDSNKDLIPEHIVNEYTKLIQYEYYLYKKEHYHSTDKKPLVTSLDSYSIEFEHLLSNDFEESDETIMVREALVVLKKKNSLYHKIVILHHFEGRSFVEIAKITGYSRQTISNKFDKAKAELKKILEGNENGFNSENGNE